MATPAHSSLLSVSRCYAVEFVGRWHRRLDQRHSQTVERHVGDAGWLTAREAQHRHSYTRQYVVVLYCFEMNGFCQASVVEISFWVHCVKNIFLIYIYLLVLGRAVSRQTGNLSEDGRVVVRLSVRVYCAHCWLSAIYRRHRKMMPNKRLTVDRAILKACRRNAVVYVNSAKTVIAFLKSFN